MKISISKSQLSTATTRSQGAISERSLAQIGLRGCVVIASLFQSLIVSSSSTATWNASLRTKDKHLYQLDCSQMLSDSYPMDR